MTEFTPPNYTHDASRVEAIVKEGNELFMSLMGVIKAIDCWERDKLNPYVEETGLEEIAWGDTWPEGTEPLLQMYRYGPSVDDELRDALLTLEEMYPDDAD
jgi:hypothetical protein